MPFPLAIFQHNHHQKNGLRRGRGINPVSSSIINPMKEIGLAKDRTGDLLFSSSLTYRLSYTGKMSKIELKSSVTMH